MKKGYICTVIAVICWGASFIGTKIACSAFSPLFLCFLRFAAAVPVMALWRALNHDHEKPEGKDKKMILLSSIVGVSVYYASENIAVDMTTASTASLIAGAYPVITALIGIVFFHDHFDRKRLAGIALAVAGVFILTNIDISAEAKNPLAGNTLLIFDGFLWALYNYLIPAIDDRYSAMTVTYYQFLYGVIFMIPLAFITPPVTGEITLSVILAVVFLSAVCSVGAYIMYNYGLKTISAGAAASIMNLMPVAGLILSALILHETIVMRHIIGGAVILTGVLISSAQS